MHDIIVNIISICVGMTIVSLLQMRRSRKASMRIEKAADHFEAATDAHDEYLRKVREHTSNVLRRLHQAVYVAEMHAGLKEELRISKEIPEDITSIPTLRPRTPAQKAKAKHGKRRPS